MKSTWTIPIEKYGVRAGSALADIVCLVFIGHLAHAVLCFLPALLKYAFRRQKV